MWIISHHVNTFTHDLLPYLFSAQLQRHDTAHYVLFYVNTHYDDVDKLRGRFKV